MPAQLSTLVPAALMMLTAQFLFDIPDGPGAAGLRLVVVASAACFAAVLFVPVADRWSWTNFARLVVRCAGIAVLFVFLAMAEIRNTGAVPGALTLAVTICLLSVIVLLPVLATQGTAGAVRQAVFVLAALLFLAPLWLAPLAEVASRWTALPDVIIAVSPVSALATAVDLDYLRSPWFYRHSVLGSLRYEYLPWSTYVIIFLAMIGGSTILAIRRNAIGGAFDDSQQTEKRRTQS